MIQLRQVRNSGVVFGLGAARLRGRSRIASFSVQQPLAGLVDALNAFRPAVLTRTADDADER